MSYFRFFPLLFFCAILTLLVIGHSSITKLELVVSVCRVKASDGHPLEVVWVPDEIFRNRKEEKGIFWTTPAAVPGRSNPSCWQLPAPFALEWFWKKMFDADYGDWGPKLISELDSHARILALRRPSVRTAIGGFQVHNISGGLWLRNAPGSDAETQSELFKRLDPIENDLRLPASFTISNSLNSPSLRALDPQLPFQGAWIQFSRGKIRFQSRLYGGVSVSAECQLTNILICGRLSRTQSTVSDASDGEEAFQKNCRSVGSPSRPADLDQTGVRACLFDRILSLMVDCPDGDPTKLRKLLNDVLMIPPGLLPPNLIAASIKCLGRPHMPKIAQLWTDALKTGVEFHHAFRTINVTDK